jgi:hypothetical protein
MEVAERSKSKENGRDANDSSPRPLNDAKNGWCSASSAVMRLFGLKHNMRSSRLIACGHPTTMKNVPSLEHAERVP